MFFTINSIQGFLIDVDGFLSLNGKKIPVTDFSDDSVHENVNEIRVIKKLGRIVEILKENPITFVSSYGEDDVRKILASSSVPQEYTLVTGRESAFFDAVLIEAIKKLNLRPEKCVYVCADNAHLQSAHEVSLGTILFKKRNCDEQEQIRNFRQFPDYILDKSADLSDVLSGKTRGFGAEVLSVPLNFSITPKNKEQYVTYFEIPNLENPTTPIFVFGRCYSTSDPRFKRHALSVRIINSKKYPERQATLFATIFANGIVWVAKQKIDIITRVPPRPNCPLDRFGIYLEKMKGLAILSNPLLKDARISLSVLKCIRNYPTLHTDGLTALQRRKAVRGAFEASQEVNGKRVAVVEDVMTTGATINETIQTLLEAGATEIIPVIIAYHPLNFNISGTESIAIPFENGEGIAVPRCAKKEFEQLGRGIFFGSSMYDPAKPSSGFMPFTETVRKINQAYGDAILAKSMKLDEEIPF